MANSHQSTYGIRLQTLSSAHPNIVPANASTTPHSLNAVLSNPNINSNSGTTVHNALSLSGNSTTQLAQTATALPIVPKKQSWKIWKALSSNLPYLWKVLIIITTLLAAWMAFRLATWTAAKDWKQYCDAQTESAHATPTNCWNTSNSILSPPPWVGGWFGENQPTRSRRDLNRMIEGTQIVRDFIKALGLLCSSLGLRIEGVAWWICVGTFIIGVVILTINVLGRFFASSQRPGCAVPVLRSFQTTGTSLTESNLSPSSQVWVSNSVPRFHLSSQSTGLAKDSSLKALRKRQPPQEDATLESAEDSEWEPANMSLIHEQCQLSIDEVVKVGTSFFADEDGPKPHSLRPVIHCHEICLREFLYWRDSFPRMIIPEQHSETIHGIIFDRKDDVKLVPEEKQSSKHRFSFSKPSNSRHRTPRANRQRRWMSR